ncbi:NERD domain-containing protein, partial|uniref:nuclease-related domain-containing protein n=1 Tax=Dendrosporobacter quercicolus TaxID=146817 RepID=UPI00156E12CD
EINEEFEVEIYELLKNSLSKKILYNFTKIGSKPPFIEPPGQIDILLYYQYNLYVIECKNYDLKTNIPSVANEVKRIQNDEIGKLEKKVRFVKENLRSILPLIGVDILEADSIENVTGLFVTKNFSVGELLTNQLPIINYSSLIDWIKSKNEF